MHGSTEYYAWSFSDSNAASPQQTQTNNDASGNPQRVAGRPPLLFVRVTVLQLTTGQKNSGRPLRYRIQAMEITQSQVTKIAVFSLRKTAIF